MSNDSNNFFRVKFWIEQGAPKEKLVLGIPTYGNSWTLTSAGATAMGSSASGAGDPGIYTETAGFLGYHEICLNIKNNDWVVVQDLEANMGPYAYKDKQWVGYDDVNMVGVKAQYILDNDLGGAMFWDITMDDFMGDCGGERFPLISKVHDILSICSGVSFIFMG